MNTDNLQIYQMDETPSRKLSHTWREIRDFFPALVGFWKFTLLRELKEGKARGV
jgi:hypothetical protein